jgi:putative membrane protein
MRLKQEEDFMGILGIIVLIVLIVWAWSYFREHKGFDVTPRRDSALDILEQRYARGEINKEEFEEKKKDLSQ